MYRLFIAFRYLLHKRINLLAVIGVAISVAVLFVVHSVMTGFAQRVMTGIRGNISDLTVERYGESFSGYEEAMPRLEKLPHVKAVSPRFGGIAFVKVGDREEYATARFEGIDLQRECRTTQLADYWRKAEEEEHKPVDEPTWGTAGKKGLSPAIVGKGLVMRRDEHGGFHSLGVGDKIVLVAAPKSGLEPEIQPCVIAGKFASGNYEYDAGIVLIPLADAQDLLRKPGRVTSIAIRLDDYRNARETQAAILGIATLDEIERVRTRLQQAGKSANPPAAVPLEDKMRELRRNYIEWRGSADPLYIQAMLEVESAYFAMMDRLKASGAADKSSDFQELKALRNALADRYENSLGASPGPGYRVYQVQTWEDKPRELMTAIRVERAITVIVQSFVFLLAWALIYSILSSAVVEKTKDIGVLRSLGATKYGVMSIFLLNGFIIGLIGAAIGIVGGALFCSNINSISDWIYGLTGFRVFPPDVYGFDKIPVDSNPTEWAIVITSIALIVSVAGAYIPARKAANLNPVDALRYE